MRVYSGSPVLPGAVVDRLESPLGSSEIDRRSGLDRRIDPRRSGEDRRKRARRATRVRVSSDHRRGKDRRRDQRRGVFERRARVGRRHTDRRRETPAPYSPDDATRLRLMIKTDPMLVTCPLCYRHLTAARSKTTGDADIWEIRCPDCRRTALITDVTSLRVQLIYGDATVRDALSVVLERAGHLVVEGTDAASEQGGRPFDVVIIDLQLPAMEGIDVIRRIKRETPETRIIALAGRRQIGVPDTSVTAKRLGAAVVIRKPFTPPAILAALDEVVGNQ